MSLRQEKVVVSLALLALLGGGFLVIAPWTAARAGAAPPWLATIADARLPLRPEFVWIYLSWYPATAVALLGDRVTFRRAYVAYVIAFGFCVAGYAAFPVTLARPTLDTAQGLSESALAALYAFDPPVNLFPSFHAAIAAILCRLASGTRAASGVRAWTAAVCAACVFAKQHYLLDVATGALVGIVALEAADATLRRFAAYSSVAGQRSDGVCARPVR